MKGKNHLLISFGIILLLVFGLMFFDIQNDMRIIYNFPIPFGVIIISLFLFFIGSILPDADSNNKGSFIYVLVPIALKDSRKNKYKKKDTGEEIGFIIFILFGLIAYPMGWITNQLEKLILKYTKRQRGHRQSLHTIFGISVISIFWAMIFYVIYLYFSRTEFSIITPLIFALSLFIGQLLHLIEDIQHDWKISWK